jgi:glycosyltransferase involved in cell wall biosynthesis
LIQHGRNGWLFQPKDTRAVITVLEEALQQRADWGAIGAAAREAVSQYDLDLIADRYAELCRRLLNSIPPQAVTPQRR